MKAKPKTPPKQPRQITVSNVRYEIDSTVILDALQLSILHHKTPIVGMIGHNGAGKTTLAKIIAGQIKCQGNLHIVGDVWYMQQERDIPDTVTVRAYLSNFIDGDREEYKITAILEELDLDTDCMDQMIGTMSWGQKRKIQFAKLILQDKKILILDEPTNHIDDQTKQRLVDWMCTQSEKLLFLVISHDRDFLNMVAKAIVLVADGKAKLYEGAYDQYLEDRAKELDSQSRQYDVYLKRKQKLESWLITMRKRAAVTDNPALGRLINNKEKYMEREVLGKAAPKPDDYKGLQVDFAEDKTRHARLLEWSKQDIIQPDSGRVLIKQSSAAIYAGEKIVLYGPNGSGKTTLINRLLRHEHMDYYSTQLSIGVCDQYVRGLPAEMRVRDFLIDLHQMVHTADNIFFL
jgi:macrolide transport system ATP-binding/permease protein